MVNWGKRMLKKAGVVGVIAISVLIIIIWVLWDKIFLDVLLDPLKVIVETKLGPLLNASPPGSVGLYVSIIIIVSLILIAIFISLTKRRNGNVVYAKRERDLKEFIFNFTENGYKNNFVIATQIYRYKFSRTNHKMKINYQDGYIVDDERINAVIQDNFQVDSDLFKEFEEAKKQIQETDNLSLMSTFLVNCLHDLNASPHIINTNKEVNQFLLSILGVQYLLNSNGSNDILSTYRLNSLLSHPEKEQTLYRLSKTGLMRAILNAELNLSTIYSFQHIGTGDKEGRVYLTLQVIRKEDPTPYIFLITVSPQILNQANQNQILAKILEEFVGQLQKEIEVEEIQSLSLIV